MGGRESEEEEKRERRKRWKGGREGEERRRDKDLGGGMSDGAKAFGGDLNDMLAEMNFRSNCLWIFNKSWRAVIVRAPAQERAPEGEEGRDPELIPLVGTFGRGKVLGSEEEKEEDRLLGGGEGFEKRGGLEKGASEERGRRPGANPHDL